MKTRSHTQVRRFQAMYSRGIRKVIRVVGSPTILAGYITAISGCDRVKNLIDATRALLWESHYHRRTSSTPISRLIFWVWEVLCLHEETLRLRYGRTLFYESVFFIATTGEYFIVNLYRLGPIMRLPMILGNCPARTDASSLGNYPARTRCFLRELHAFLLSVCTSNAAKKKIQLQASSEVQFNT